MAFGVCVQRGAYWATQVLFGLVFKFALRSVISLRSVKLLHTSITGSEVSERFSEEGEEEEKEEEEEEEEEDMTKHRKLQMLGLQSCWL